MDGDNDDDDDELCLVRNRKWPKCQTHRVQLQADTSIAVGYIGLYNNLLSQAKDK